MTNKTNTGEADTTQQEDATGRLEDVIDKLSPTPTERIAKYIMENSPMGGGDDPVGFLLASHADLMCKDPQGLVEVLKEVKSCLGRDHWQDKKATYHRILNALAKWEEQ